MRSMMSIAGAALVAATSVHAQARTTVAIDGTVGTGNGTGGEFTTNHFSGARLALSVRRGSPGHVGFFGEGDVEWLGIQTGSKALCVPSSRGGCRPDFPPFAGAALLAGVVMGAGPLEVRLGAGGGSYSAAGTRAAALTTLGDVALFPVTHVGILLGTRWIVVPDYRGDRISMRPWMVGVRVR